VLCGAVAWRSAAKMDTRYSVATLAAAAMSDVSFPVSSLKKYRIGFIVRCRMIIGLGDHRSQFCCKNLTLALMLWMNVLL
jgi:hypothetical protein